ncbi:MAG: NAD(P)/FAD-dependent oxidoreductase [Elusimicrobia bacterium]|nr:NAD(P)/FAD-dependent oxidoreductase [Elusimicrobiota bacterium]MBU2615224.1 NAD(P)/FAD-dependent oxidoreductase [Elusimicrobiota bacterium]
MNERELVIVGGGPAGMAAAIAAYNTGIRDILLIERNNCLGGILNQCVHTGFGLKYFNDILTGPEYAERFIDKLKAIPEIEISLKSFVVNLAGDKVLKYLRFGKLETVKAKSLIMATGCRERTREMINIAGSRPAGIFPAGLAQKLINIEGLMPGKNVVVIGSGDIGLIMARRFTLEGAQVKAVIEIMDRTKGLQRNVVQCLEDFNIPLYLRHKVKFINGKDRVESVDITGVDRQLKEIPGTQFNIACDTVLVSVGLIPENELIEMAGVEIDERTNCPKSNKVNMTSIPGVFVCGNAYKVYDLVDWATRDSELAGKMAADFIRVK